MCATSMAVSTHNFALLYLLFQDAVRVHSVHTNDVSNGETLFTCDMIKLENNRIILLAICTTTLGFVGCDIVTTFFVPAAIHPLAGCLTLTFALRAISLPRPCGYESAALVVLASSANRHLFGDPSFARVAIRFHYRTSLTACRSALGAGPRTRPDATSA